MHILDSSHDVTQLIFLNMVWQLHWEAWVRFGVVTVIAILVYGFYGQYNAITETSISENSPLYYKAPIVDELDILFEDPA